MSIFSEHVECCHPNSDTMCFCSPEERVLRAYAEGRTKRPMTGAQRDWCFKKVGRRFYLSDRKLAINVLKSIEKEFSVSNSIRKAILPLLLLVLSTACILVWLI